MGRRREGREAAVQYLVAHESQSTEPEKSITAGDEAFWDLHMAKKGARAFAEELIKGVLGHLAEIDPLIEKTVENYRMERLTGVDRNIIRLAVYELLHATDAPPPVVINEAIEIAKKFGTNDSASFVNGILDRIAKASGRQTKSRSPENNAPTEQPTDADS